MFRRESNIMLQVHKLTIFMCRNYCRIYKNKYYIVYNYSKRLSVLRKSTFKILFLILATLTICVSICNVIAGSRASY